MVTKVTTYDWEGYYQDDKLFAQGNIVDAHEILEALGEQVQSIHIEEDDLDQFGNCLPSSLEELKQYLNNKNSPPY